MNSENLEFLKNGMKYLGFDEALGIELAKQMKEGNEAIVLKTHLAFGKDGADKMDAMLHFSKSKQGDMYFFNNYSANIREGKEIKEQNFYLNKNKGVTAKEAYNLLHGRSVNKDLVSKEGEKYNAWIKLDFDNTDDHGNYKVKQFHSNYGYDLEKAVGQHPVKELADQEQKDKLMKSLEKGNVQSVTFTKDGKEERMFLEANPQYKSVTVYDSQMKKVRDEQVNKEQGKEATAAGELKAGGRSKTKKNVDDLMPQAKQEKKAGLKM